MVQHNHKASETGDTAPEAAPVAAQNIAEGVFGSAKATTAASFRNRICNRSEWWLNVDYAEHIHVDSGRSVTSLPESA